MINDSLAFAIVKPEKLTPTEIKIWNTKDIIINVIGGLPNCVKNIVISEILEENVDSTTLAYWQPDEGRIVILRTLLSSEVNFIGVLLHELAHAISSAKDETREFEDELSNLLGYLGQQIVRMVSDDKKKIKKPDRSKSGFASVNLTCKCVDCFGEKFDYDHNKTIVKCKKCGREYCGGYTELVQLNRVFIKQNGIDSYKEEMSKRLTKILFK